MDNTSVLDTSSPRSENMLLRRERIVPINTIVLSSPRRPIIAAAGPVSTPASAAEASPQHFAILSMPSHKTTQCWTSALPQRATKADHDVSGLCLLARWGRGGWGQSHLHLARVGPKRDQANRQWDVLDKQEATRAAVPDELQSDETRLSQ